MGYDGARKPISDITFLFYRLCKMNSKLLNKSHMQLIQIIHLTRYVSLNTINYWNVGLISIYIIIKQLGLLTPLIPPFLPILLFLSVFLPTPIPSSQLRRLRLQKTSNHQCISQIGGNQRSNCERLSFGGVYNTHPHLACKKQWNYVLKKNPKFKPAHPRIWIRWTNL